MCLGNVAFSLDPARRVSQYIHDRWGDENGLLGGAIYAIGQSDDGYLWMGTERGLVRFDGTRFTLIQRPISDDPPVGPVRGLISDIDGNLWVLLEGARMLLYHDGKFEDLYAQFDLQGIIVTASASDDRHRILLAGLGYRTLRYDNKQFEIVVDAKDSPGTVISLAATPDQSVWLGTREYGLFRSYHGRISKAAPELRNSKINCLSQSKNGGLWIGTDNGVYLMEVGATKLFSLSSLSGLRIFTMTRDYNNNLWIGTNHGIVRVTSFGAISLDLFDRKSVHEVRAIFEDRDGDIWFGGPQGVERLRNGMMTSYSEADGLPAGAGGPIYADSKNRIWFAPISGGLFLLDASHATRITLDGLDHDVVYSISGGGDEVWIGRQHGGLTVLTEDGGSFSARTYGTSDGLVQDSVYSVRRGRDGTIWAGTVSSGVSRLSDGKFTNYSDADGLPSNSVNSITEAFDGTIWVATPSGLASYSDAHWKNYTARDGLPSSSVRFVFDDSRHNLWIATSRGLSYLSSGKIRVPNSLPEILQEQIFGIAEDSMGYLWFTTSDHVVRVNREKLLAGSLLETDIQSFGAEDGLKGTGAFSRNDTVVGDHAGRIWLSLSSGLSMADPNITARNSAPVTVRIESVFAGGRQLDIEHAVRIPPGVQSITLNYGDSNLSTPEKIRFRYKLDAPNQGWSDIVASKQVVYSNLGPGMYRFRILASNSLGLWNGPESTISFVIEPTFWQTRWFRAFCFTLLLAVLWLAYAFRIRRVTALLHLRYQERLLEREDIARDLHDTFFQAVQSLFLRFHTASRQIPEHDSVRQTIEEVLNDSDRVMSEGREMFLDVPKKEPAERDFAQLLAEYCADFSAAYPIEYRVQVDGSPRSIHPLVIVEMSKIAREGTYNAFRHSKAKNIEVELTYGSRELRLCIRDNGQGFEPAVFQPNSGYQHLGLQNMRKRAQKLGADLRLWSRMGIGTEVEVVLNAQHAYIAPQKSWRFTGLTRRG